jgi:iron(III) transport system substrate-binding protein
MATLIKKWGNDKGMDYFRKLAAMKPDVRKGHVLLAELIAAGEVPVGSPSTTATSSRSRSAARPSTSCRSSRSPRARRASASRAPRRIRTPRSCSLDFVLSPEGQRLFESMGRVPASTAVKSNLNNFPFTLIDPVTILDESEKWGKLWDELFIRK